jgi:hypothetical protein
MRAIHSAMFARFVAKTGKAPRAMQGPPEDAARQNAGDQDTTQLGNRTGIRADAGQLVPEKIARLPKREGPSTGDGLG